MKIIIALLIGLTCYAANAQDRTIPFLVVYKEENVSTLRSLRGLKLQAYLKMQTAKNERMLVQKVPSIRGLSSDQAKTLWILNSSILKLNAQQANEIKALSFVNRMIQLEGQMHLIRPAQSQEVVIENTKDYTYGLIRIGVPEIRTQFQQLTGEGVRVGIIDSGIDDSHPDLKGKVIQYRNFVVESEQKPSDEIGHGTHVAGTIVGGNSSGRSIGVAPAAKLVIAKIFSNSATASLDKILLSLQWMTDPDGITETDDAVHVVNNSWGSPATLKDRDPQDDPFCAVLNRMRAMNVLPVFAAGNSGPRADTISNPGACPDALTVGATNSRDQITSFSSKGAAKWKTVTVNKPDISAPGADVISSMPRGRYAPMSGTSMASPHVTGVIAILKQARPDLNHKALGDLAIASSKDLGTEGYDHTFGYGRLDVKKAIQTLLSQGRR